ncbi:methyl-accepting chemotaxis protein [Salinicola sp. LHM]|uniref:methyl-accepting chemotaxis protein n=1 Tax=Salinicola TaxID=404432 RepID=UPI0023E3DD3C|nr:MULTISPECIES: methyl-accepting chemotaxis protein [Salinicola]MDF3920538.1 methyl-accepting chemotaxis protein [Salinicola salarius]MEC8916178.1 methyl-accepting chemotaxis protein [Pseudomonadota bacterium]MED5501008.1 methyl-accepting chemotaxis protein [Pseudomonadota bacterium]WQH33904.1 methyl-accepting chemotaxis protein [Salinicola sp. LHM]
MKNLSVRRSLTLALVVLVAMIGAISGVGFYSNSTSSDVIDELSEINIEQTNTLNRTQVNLLGVRIMLEKAAALSRQSEDKNALAMQQRAQEALDRAMQRYAEFQRVPTGEDSRRDPYVDAINAAYTELVPQTLQPLLANSDPDEIRREEQRLDDNFAAFDEASRAFVRYVEERGDELIADDAQSTLIVEIVSITLLLLALVAALLVRIAMIRTVVNPLQEAVDHFDRIANGDLTAEIENRGTNEIGRLFGALKNMQVKLSELVLSLRNSSDSVFTGAGEIASGSQNLSTRTEEQASALQETASSMEQMASTVRQNTDSAIEADRLSSGASQAAETGGKEVQRTADLMREIAASSRKIQEIIGVIDSIAFQTNILALNASVEAARAGEQGRGFAVVASEVRLLASRSADSAKEIRTMIEETTSKIEVGAEQAERSGQTINETVDAIRQVSTLMNEIATATREQNSGIDQINVAVTQMDSVTQQNASLVEQTSAAAASLESQAKHLAELIATFRVNGAAAPATTASLAKDVPQSSLPAPSRKPKTSVRTVATEEEWSEF